MVVRFLPLSEIPKFIDQPDAKRATRPVHSKDISQVTSEARGPGKMAGPISTPQSMKAKEVPGSSRFSLREQLSSLRTPGISGDKGALDTGQRGEAGTGERTVSLETRNSEFAPYLANVKRRISRVWDYPAYARNIGLTGDLVLVFSITKDGNLAHVRIAKSSGVSILDEAAIEAVKAAAPYARFPAKFTIRQLNIFASFGYAASAAPLREPR
jgi:protein TonB